MKTEDAKTLAESALDTLAAQLDAGKSASLTAYLASMARFHHYSANNILLIHAQRQDATRVAGFSAWRKLGRFVRRGEKGIAILVPMTLRRSFMTPAMASGPTTSRPHARFSASSLVTCSM
jgi:hypothetical protein